MNKLGRAAQSGEGFLFQRRSPENVTSVSKNLGDLRRLLGEMNPNNRLALWNRAIGQQRPEGVCGRQINEGPVLDDALSGYAHCVKGQAAERRIGIDNQHVFVFQIARKRLDHHIAYPEPLFPHIPALGILDDFPPEILTRRCQLSRRDIPRLQRSSPTSARRMKT